MQLTCQLVPRSGFFFLPDGSLNSNCNTLSVSLSLNWCLVLSDCPELLWRALTVERRLEWCLPGHSAKDLSIRSHFGGQTVTLAELLKWEDVWLHQRCRVRGATCNFSHSLWHTISLSALVKNGRNLESEVVKWWSVRSHSPLSEWNFLQVFTATKMLSLLTGWPWGHKGEEKVLND